MEPVRLWAAVEFTAQSGSTDALLGHAAQAGLHLTRIVPLPGGFRARCAAWHYRPLAALARQGHVRLRVEKRLGLFFRLRPLLRRTGCGPGWRCLFRCCCGASNSSGPWTPAPSPADRPPGPLPYCGRQTSPQGLPPPKPSAPPGSMPCWKAASFPGPVSILPKGDWKSAPPLQCPSPPLRPGPCTACAPGAPVWSPRPT